MELWVDQQSLNTFVKTDGGHQFLVAFGEIGMRFGMSRIAGQVIALLYLSEQPLTQQEIADGLDISRSTLVGSLREVITLGFVKSVYVLGDRRERYEGLRDAWDIYQLAIRNRLNQEIVPALDAIDNVIRSVDQEKDDIFVKRQLKEMREVAHCRMLEYEKVSGMDKETLKKWMCMDSDKARIVLEHLFENI